MGLKLENRPVINNNTNNKADNSTKQNFKGVGEAIGNGLTAGLTMCNTYPVLGVTVIDTATAIAPRTIVDAQTNNFAAFETFRRESSGLLVNCLIPSAIAFGVGKGIHHFVVPEKYRNLGLDNSWANGNNIDKLGTKFEIAKGSDDVKVANFVKGVINSLEGFDVNEYKKFSDFDLKDEIKTLTDCILDKNMSKKELNKKVKEACNSIIKKTNSEKIIKFSEDSNRFASNLPNLIRDTVDLGRKFNSGMKVEDIKDFKKVATKFVNAKSLGAFAILIPLACAVQPINRAITRWTSGISGAPIYKDFGKDKDKNSNKPKEKPNLLKEKLTSSALMVGLAILSCLKKPTLGMFQFEGPFPTMNQCRWVATATNISRVAAAEDKNEVKEATGRDCITFAALYFMGDYISKGVATIIEKINPKVKLLNRMAKPDAQKGIIGNFKDWVCNTHLKTFNEIPNKTTKNLRSLCEISHLGVAMLVLGIISPVLLRRATEKRRAAELAQEKMNEQNNINKEVNKETKKEIKKEATPQK